MALETGQEMALTEPNLTLCKETKRLSIKLDMGDWEGGELAEALRGAFRIEINREYNNIDIWLCDHTPIILAMKAGIEHFFDGVAWGLYVDENGIFVESETNDNDLECRLLASWDECPVRNVVTRDKLVAILGQLKFDDDGLVIEHDD